MFGDMKGAIAAAAAGALVVGRAGATKMQLTLFDNTAPGYENAKCNDGSPAGYYFRPSPTGSKVWLMHQQGGGWCYDKASCNSRSGNSASSKGWAAELDMAGIFNATIPELRDANLVFAPYCECALPTLSGALVR